MNSRKNGFLVFICSLVPGAGEMYLGFMKQGISIMTIFWGIIFIAAGLDLEVVIFLLPIIWCYSFFHVHNLKKLPYDKFEAEKDEFLIPESINLPKVIGKRANAIVAGILIFIGIAIIWNSIIIDLVYNISSYIHFPSWIVDDILTRIPQFVLAVILIVAGVILIKGKYKEVYHSEEEYSHENERYKYQKDAYNNETEMHMDGNKMKMEFNGDFNKEEHIVSKDIASDVLDENKRVDEEEKA